MNSGGWGVAVVGVSFKIVFVFKKKKSGNITRLDRSTHTHKSLTIINNNPLINNR